MSLREDTVALAPLLAHLSGVDDRQAAVTLTAAANLLADRDPATAARWYATASALLPADTEDERERAHLRLAATAASPGEIEAASAGLEALLLTLPGGEDDTEAAVVAALAEVERLRGDLAVARARLEGGLARAATTGRDVPLSLRLEQAAEAIMRRDLVAARRASAANGDGAASSPELEAMRAALAVCAAADGLDRANLIHVHAAAAQAVDALPDARLATRVESSFWLAIGEDWGDVDLAGAVGHFERGARVARRAGRPELVVMMLSGLAQAREHRGDLGASDRASAEAEALARRLAAPGLISAALLARCSTAACRGDARTIAACRREHTAMAAVPDGVYETSWGQTLARAALAISQGQDAVELVLEAGDNEEFAGVPVTGCALRYDALVRGSLARGDVGAADTWAAQAQELAGVRGGAFSQAIAARGAASVALASEDWGAAAARAHTAGRHAARAGAKLEQAWAASLEGRALTAAGEPRDGERLLRQAAVALQAIGARPLFDEVAHALRSVGHVGPRPRSGGVLTVREHDVARLVISGMTNRQVATALFLSPHTVDQHLRRIFAKLGITRRAALADALAAEPEPGVIGQHRE